MMKKILLSTTLLLAGLISCGTTPSNSVTSISIAAGKVVLKESENTVLNATVSGTGTFDKSLTWSIEAGTAVGSLSSTTGSNVTYTAPNSTFGRVVRVTATSVQDSSIKKTIYLGVHPNKPSIAAGEHHSLALKSDGTVLAWGADASGQLGDGGSNTDKSTPVAASGATGIVAVAVGYKHSLALKPDGMMLAWGNDASGQLGDDSNNSNKSSPVTVSVFTNIIAISAGNEHSLALKSDGTVLAWGNDASGQLGDGGTNTNKGTAVAVAGATGVVAIAAGAGHSLALKSDGTVLAWGNNGSGQLGDGTNTSQSSPVTVPGLNQIVAIAAGVAHSLALKSDGTMLAWGNDGDGQLGDDTASADKSTPVAVSSASGIVAINAGSYHSFALKSDGTLLTWGDDISGQLGDDAAKTDQRTPVPVSGATGIVAVSGGLSHSLALKSDGKMLSWGDDFYGQLGNDDTKASQPTPVAVLLGMASIRLP